MDGRKDKRKEGKERKPRCNGKGEEDEQEKKIGNENDEKGVEEVEGWTKKRRKNIGKGRKGVERKKGNIKGQTKRNHGMDRKTTRPNRKKTERHKTHVDLKKIRWKRTWQEQGSSVPFSTSSFRRPYVSLDRAHAFHGRQCRPSHPCHRSSVSSFSRCCKKEVRKETNGRWRRNGAERHMPFLGCFDLCGMGRMSNRSRHACVTTLFKRWIFSWNSARARTTQATARETNVHDARKASLRTTGSFHAFATASFLGGHLVHASPGFLTWGWMLERSKFCHLRALKREFRDERCTRIFGFVG